MKSKIFRSVLSLVTGFFFVSSVAMARGEKEGNGGAAVVCRNSAGKIVSAEVLDLWEAKNYYFLDIVRDDREVEQQVDLAASTLEVLLRVYPGFQQHVDWVKKHFHILPAGVKNRPVDDAFPAIIQPGCSLEQLAVYGPDDEVRVDREIYEFLMAQPGGKTDIAALQIHEAVYSMDRDFKAATDSTASRRIVGYMFNRMAHPTDSSPYRLFKLVSDEFFAPSYYHITARVNKLLQERSAMLFVVVKAEDLNPVTIKITAKNIVTGVSQDVVTCHNQIGCKIPTRWIRPLTEPGVFLMVDTSEDQNRQVTVSLDGNVTMSDGLEVSTSPNVGGPHLISIKLW